MVKTNAIIERNISICRGIPKYSSKVDNIATKKNAIKNAPKLSIKKSLFGFKVNLLIILFSILHKS